MRIVSAPWLGRAVWHGAKTVGNRRILRIYRVKGTICSLHSRAQHDDYDLTILTDCHNSVEAGALREFLQANGIQAHIQGENHSSMLGAFGSIMIGLNILVQKRQFNEARELVASFRDADVPEDFADSIEYEVERDGNDDEIDDSDMLSGEHQSLIELDPNPPRARLVLRDGHDPAVARARALLPSFGCGHFYTGAHLRGVLLAALEIAGIALIAINPFFGFGLFAMAILMDFFAAPIRAAERRDARLPEMPSARLKTGGEGR